MRPVRKRVDLKSPVLEYCAPGPVRGAPGNWCPYLDNIWCPFYACRFSVSHSLSACRPILESKNLWAH
jgi:hypothetical protein